MIDRSRGKSQMNTTAKTERRVFQITPEDKVRDCVEKVVGADFFSDRVVRWIVGGFARNQHLVIDIWDCKFTHRDFETMKFTATVRVKHGRDLQFETVTSLVWTMKDDKFRGEFGNL